LQQAQGVPESDIAAIVTEAQRASVAQHLERARTILGTL
jgi:hypothetical protein